MKYCAKCGKELSEEATICIHCGCAVQRKPHAHSQEPSGNMPHTAGTIIKQNVGILWLVSMLGGLEFGVVMMLIIGPPGILSGILFGVLFGLAMQIMTGSLEKKWAAKRAEVSATKTIIVEGGANLDGNGGWLFVTAESVEFYTHRVNIDHKTLIFCGDEVQSIHKEGMRLAVVANNTKYVFVVDNVDRWLKHIKPKSSYSGSNRYFPHTTTPPTPFGVGGVSIQLYTKPRLGYLVWRYCLGGDHGQGGFIYTVCKPHFAVRTTAPVSVIR